MHTIRYFTASFRIFLLLFLLTGGCSEESEPPAATSGDDSTNSCKRCHTVELDQNHRFACSSCHAGNAEGATREQAHDGLVSQPAHPDNAGAYCGSCHETSVDMVLDNNHYTLRDHISLVRQAFGAKNSPGSPLLLQPSADPQTSIELTDDLLRRRCLRCHVYDEGDDFAGVKRATGCGACHLSYSGGKMESHVFLEKPDDSRCLSCHYGNHVGFDYYGRYEHDFNEEYRTPYRQDSVAVRQFGVEYHELEPDIHQQAGMVCIDCHLRSQVMGSAKYSHSCKTCHEPGQLQKNPPGEIEEHKEGYTYSSPTTGITLALPVMKHPAHLDSETLSCQACHARWSFNDGETFLLRLDHDYFDDFYKLSLDGSYEVNTIIRSHLSEDGDWLEPRMSDKFTGRNMEGIWYKGYTERRWDQPILLRDSDGMITVGRPVLDLSLSWIDSEETVRFDNVRPVAGTRLVQPYTPHTIGPAGLFYEQRLRRLLPETDRRSPSVDR